MPWYLRHSLRLRGMHRVTANPVRAADDVEVHEAGGHLLSTIAAVRLA
jgi:hypothetical protein